MYYVMPDVASLRMSTISTFIIWQGKSEHSDWFFLNQNFAIRIVSMETVISCVFLCFRKPANSKQAWTECHIINYLLTY